MDIKNNYDVMNPEKRVKITPGTLPGEVPIVTSGRFVYGGAVASSLFSPSQEYNDIVIEKTSTALVPVTTNTTGSYIIMVSDTDPNGAHSVFVGSKSGSGRGHVTRLSSARGTEGQSIDADWLTGEEVKIYHKPAGSGGGNYTYRVKIYSVM